MSTVTITTDTVGLEVVSQVIEVSVPNSLTITGGSGVSALAMLTDVDLVTDPPADNDVLAFDASTLKWSPATLTGGPGGGSGDVVGPASATDGAAAVFDGITGKLLKDGPVLGTAATTASTAYATAAQGDLADTALQSGSGFNTPGGWLKLDGDGTAPDNRIPASIARDTEVDTKIATHSAATDPHGDRAWATGLLVDKADLVGGLVPSAQLPGYVDDVLEFANFAAFPGVGESGKIYVAIDTNLTYRWGGSNYVMIGSDLALGETSATAYRGDRGKAAYDHSQLVTGNPHGVTAAQVGADPAGSASAAQAAAIAAAATDATTKANAKVADAINDGTTTVAPSQNAVFDALALKAPLASPALTGTPTAPTAAPGTNTTQVATTAFVAAAGRVYSDRVSVFLPANAIRAGYAMYQGSATSTPPNSLCSLGFPFRPSVNSTLTGVQLEVVGGSAGSKHRLALYLCGDDGQPAALSVLVPLFACDTAGYKSQTGLTVPLVAGQVYAFGSVANVAGHTLRGVATATTGLPQLTVGSITATSALYAGGDNLYRGQGFRHTNAVAGVPDASPSWTLVSSFLEIPNIGITLVAA